MTKFSLTVALAAILTLFSCGNHDTASDNVLDKYLDVDSVRHIAVVQCLGGSDARVSIYAKDSDSVKWNIVRESDAFIGRNGFTSDKKEGDGMTPLGDFGILSAFGIFVKPQSCRIEYTHIDENTYAVDSVCEFYNKIIDASQGGPRQGEHMIEYAPEYNYGLALDYNKECVRGRGSNIFFHCKGAKPSTGGCVAVDESLMKGIVSCFGPADRVVILPK